MREVRTLSGMGHGGVYTFWRVQSYKSRNATRDAFRRISVDEACSFQSDPSLPKLPSIRAVGMHTVCVLLQNATCLQLTFAR